MIISDLTYLEVVAEASTVLGGTSKHKPKKEKVKNTTTTTVVASPVQVNNAEISLVAKPQVVLVGEYIDTGDLKVDIAQKVDLNQENNNIVNVYP